MRMHVETRQKVRRNTQGTMWHFERGTEQLAWFSLDIFCAALKSESCESPGSYRKNVLRLRPFQRSWLVPLLHLREAESTPTPLSPHVPTKLRLTRCVRVCAT